MAKININLSIDNENNITISNDKSTKTVTIQYSNKMLNAKDVYDILDFKKNNSYEITSDVDNVEDKNVKDYYTDIINLFEDIKDKLNELVINEEDD